MPRPTRTTRIPLRGTQRLAIDEIHPGRKAKLLDGKEIEFDASGLLARALQHEVDHLHGSLFIDRMNAAAKASLAGRGKRLQKQVRET